MSATDTGPFSLVPEWVIDAVGPRALQVYAVIARFADDQAVAWPSRKALAERCDASTDTIDRAVDELVEAGALLVNARFSNEGDRTSNEYRVLRVPPGGRMNADTGGGTNAAGTKTTMNEKKTRSSTKTQSSTVAASKRKQDPVWDAFAACFGQPATSIERQRMNTAVREARQALEAESIEDPDRIRKEVAARFLEARSEYSTFTPVAIVANWNELGRLARSKA